MKKLIQAFVLAVVAALVMTCPALSDTLWYNGDFGGIDGLTNSTYNNYLDPPAIQSAQVFDDFTVPKGGWHITSVYSNNMLFGTFSQAYWAIREKVGVGDAGKLVAEGTGPATMTPTGRHAVWGPGYDEYTIMVSGLNIDLKKGHYWLCVEPISTSLNDYGWISATVPGNGNAFFNDPNGWGYFISSLDVDYTEVDFSMGINGPTCVPIPGSALLLGTGLTVMVLRRRG